MKKRVFFISLFLLLTLFLITLINSQIPLMPAPGEDIGESGLPETFEKTQEVIENLSDEEIRREYLSKKWDEIIKTNPFFSAVDNAFKKINILFVILFGMDYEFSLTLLFVIILWIAAVLTTNTIIHVILSNKTDSSLSLSNPSPMIQISLFVVTILIPIILAQIQLLKYLANFLIKLIFYPESSLARFIIGVLIFIIIIIYMNTMYSVKKQSEESSEEQAKEEEKRNRKILGKIVRKFLKR